MRTIEAESYAVWTYPVAPEDQLEANAALLGSFWPSTYGGAAEVLDYVRATMFGEKELIKRLNDIYDGVSRLDCPVFHRIKYLPIAIKQSEVQVAGYRLIGGGSVIGPQPGSGLVYNVGQTVGNSVSCPAPAGLAGGLAIGNAVTAPTVLMTAGLGFSVDRANGRLVFAENPFSNPLLTPEAVPNDPEDQQIPLWLYEADLDEDLVNKHIAYQIGLELPSNDASKAALNTLLDCIVQGTTTAGLRACLAVIADAPVAKEAETVEDVHDGDGFQWVITDKNVYRFGSGAEISVETGQVLQEGDILADAAALYELSRGVGPALDSLTLPAGLLTGVAGPLTFSGTPVDLEVSSESGFTRLDWELDGDADDVTAFFDLLHAKGVAAGATLANHMDTRTNPVGQPDARHLPTTINPLQFLYENVLRGNALIAVLKPDAFGPDALGIDYLWILRKVLPPHVAMLTVTS